MNKVSSLLASAALIFSGFVFISCGSDDDSQKIEFDSGDFVVSKTEIAVAGTATQSISVKSPVKPSAIADADWIHIGEITASQSSTVYTIPVWCDENLSFDIRSGNISITAGNNTKSVKVTQYGAETVEIRSVEPGNQLDATGGTLTINYAATGDVLVEAPQWLKEIKSKSLSEDKVQFEYSANYGETDRVGDVVISLVSDAAVKQTVTLTQPKVEPSTDMSDDAKAIAKKIVAGVNIGNTMECPGGETAWGNPVINENYIKGLKSLGFNAVRIPCAWDSHVSDAAANTIDPAWLARVDEVIGWVVANDMYAILNIHWDGGWLENSCSNGYDEAVDKKQRDYWSQIAAKLNHYDQHLLFAGMNEPNGTDSKAVEAIMKYQQTFVDAVRATGGNNAMRCLVHQAPTTNIDEAVSGKYSLPKDAVTGRTLVEIHFYDPSDYTIMSKDGEWGASSTVKLYWGKNYHVAGSDRNCTWGEEEHVDAQFKKMNDKYVAAGIPVILGEYGTSIRTVSEWPTLDKAVYEAGRAYWSEYVTKAAKNNGCVPFYWETGGDISRGNGSARNAYAITGIMTGAAAGSYPF